MSKNYAASYRVLASALITAAVILLSRIPTMYVNPLCAFLAKLVLTSCAVVFCRIPNMLPGLAYAVATPIFAWQMDVMEGRWVAAYALATVALMLIIRRSGQKIWLKTAVAALAATAVLIVYSVALMLLRHEMTFFGALIYSFTRQALPCLAIFAGAFLSERILQRL